MLDRQAQREKEWAERNAERKAAAAEFAGEPYHKEVRSCSGFDQAFQQLQASVPVAYVLVHTCEPGD